MRVDVQIDFDGNCEAAFKVYEACLGGTITFMLTYGASPTAADYPGMESKIAHGTMEVAGQTLIGVDVASDRYQPPQGFRMLLNLDDADKARRVFAVLAEDGVVIMPLQKTFWAEHYAVLTDRFGVPWKINCA